MFLPCIKATLFLNTVYDFLLHSTLTNVNFDYERFPPYIKQAVTYRDEIRALLEADAAKTGKPLDPALNEGPAVWRPQSGYDDIAYLEAEGK